MAGRSNASAAQPAVPRALWVEATDALLVHIHDLHATILHVLGINHEQLTHSDSGRDVRLTDVAGRVIHDIIA